MKRVVTAELLDEDLGTPEEVRASLLDLRGINQAFGGFRSVSRLLRRVGEKAHSNSLTFLDVAGGTGDVARAVTNELLQDGLRIDATILDRAISHMSAYKTSDKVAGDALRLPFASDSFDVVGCNLFCHHLEPTEMVLFFNEAQRVARIAVIASDLRRNLFHWVAAYAGRITFRSRLTHNDAPASVRRAYTIAELREIASKTTAASFEISAHYFQRFGLILWKASR